MYTMEEDSVPPSQRTQCTSILKTNSLMLYRELVYCENNKHHINRLCGQQSGLLVVQLGVHLLSTSPLRVQIFPI
jgi:hypothetical protein